MKYPRTPHLPQSPGGTRDDRRMQDLSSFDNRFLVVTEKLDGSNVCLQADACYARSHGHVPNHPSFDMFKGFHAQVKHRIPGYLQVFGEWLYARHSIHYTELLNYFMIFGVRDLRTMKWCSWAEVELWAEELGVSTVPHLFEATPQTDRDKLIAKFGISAPSKAGAPEREGFVVRWADEFHDHEFERAVGKWVRANHVQTDEHWKNQEIVRNGLRSELPKA